MNNYFIKILFCVLIINTISINVFSQNKRITIIGKVIDNEIKKTIPYAHIINFTNYKGTISDSLGIFKLKLDTGINTIKISSIGYYTKIINVDINNIVIPLIINMKERVYEIMQVEIYPFTKQEFKYQFIHKNIPKDTIAYIQDILRTRWNTVAVLRGLTPKRQIPLNFKTSIEKQEILLAKIKEYTILKEQNIKRIKIITKLEGNDLYNFDRFCKFSFNFLKNAPEYYIYVKIEKKYEEYKKLPKTKSVKLDF